jgi:hypothetical protein
MPEREQPLSTTRPRPLPYYAEKKYGYLKPTDVIGVEGTQDKDGQKTLLKITNVRTVPGKELLESCAENPRQSKRSKLRYLASYRPATTFWL